MYREDARFGFDQHDHLTLQYLDRPVEFNPHVEGTNNYGDTVMHAFNLSPSGPGPP